MVITSLAVVAAVLPRMADMPLGTLAGWLLLVAGVAEVVAGVARRSSPAGRAGIVAGAVTMVVGFLFLASPSIGPVPASYLMMAWLFVRAAILLAIELYWRRGLRSFLAIAGLADLVLGLVLLWNLPIASLVVLAFGPTQEVVASFTIIFAASFVVNGICLLAVANEDRLRA